jgi:hypothetical protein
MDSELRTRIDIGFILLAAIAGSTAVAGAEATDVATVAAGIFAAVLVTAVVLFLSTTPSWTQDETNPRTDTLIHPELCNFRACPPFPA